MYRLWLAGRWRIVYSINDDTRRVRIIRVRRKEKRDYEGL
jgi:mRNA-degrading endonuclease RelE of RelBE toxin-antitoxin system